MSDPARFFRLGERLTLGECRFAEPDIIAFAKQYDPQRFHTDPDAAEKSLFGGLCASGWHTCAVWMRFNVENIKRLTAEAEELGNTIPVFGPSPGIRDLRWRRPVYAGDRITFFRTGETLRPSASRPGWSVLVSLAEAENQNGEPVMDFQSAVLVQIAR